ncbi:protein I'm not dead yet-like [Neodiprion pinetum]|uniref:protein I'm not dead yet-like n=1 Tax=Neodiprion pinetum TaxID=441929 RepID=UPI001EE07E4F|nr:protein I'm not dead yet-like [Neodiprion pinetum]XP_046474504.1 protein I'm not dead yet-like [Neodiprion pinetum]
MSATKLDAVQVDPAARSDAEFVRKDVSFGRLLLGFFGMYWRSWIVILWPIILCPILIYQDSTAYKCMYVVAIMALYWVTEALPLPVTSFIPIVLFPLMGILNTSDTTTCYLNDTTMMFIASIVIATAIEHSGLHLRVAFTIIRLVGCSHRRLTLGIFLVTMFISLWISNTATTAMMVPIIETVLMELESQGLGKMFIEDANDTEGNEEGQPAKKPTNATMTYYFIAAYASSIGGIGTMVATGSNLTLKGIYESRFPDSPGINFSDWMCYAIPPMLVSGFLVWLWLQVMYMGMFRPNSKDSQAINIGPEGEKVAKRIIEQKYRDLGPITWHKLSVAVLFVFVILLWFFRNPGFVKGWPDYITEMSVKDSTAAMLVIILMFIIPSKLEFLNAFSKDSRKYPTKSSQGLITWKLIQTKMHWGLLFVLGGGFAISQGSTSSGLSDLLGNALSGLESLPPVATLFVICLIIQTVTEFTANVAIANIVLPVVAELCVAIKLHPLYLMLPATFCCSFSFHLPVGTPPNAIVSAAGHIKTKDFIVAGIGPTLITLIVVTVSFPTWGNVIFNANEFPSWAES